MQYLPQSIVPRMTNPAQGLSTWSEPKQPGPHHCHYCHTTARERSTGLCFAALSSTQRDHMHEDTQNSRQQGKMWQVPSSPGQGVIWEVRCGRPTESSPSSLQARLGPRGLNQYFGFVLQQPRVGHTHRQGCSRTPSFQSLHSSPSQEFE